MTSTTTDLRKKVVKAVIWSATQNWGRMVVQFLVIIVLSRLLKPEDFGLVALGIVFVAFGKVFLDMGFRPAIVQRAELQREHLDTAFWASILTGSLMAVGGLAGSELIAKFFKEPQLAPIVGWMSFIFLAGALSSTQRAILQRELAFKKLGVGLIVGDMAGGIAGVVMAFSGFGVWSLVVQHIGSDLVAAVVLWRVCNWRPGFSFSKKHFKDLFNFGGSMVGTRLVNFFKRRSDDLLVGYFLGPAALGYYTIAYQLLLVVTRLLLNVVNAVALPAFSRLQDDPERMRDAFYTATHYASLIAFPAFLGLSVMAPELIPALYGPQWEASIPVLQILGLSGILLALFFFNGPAIMAAGKPAWLLVLTALQSVVSIIVFTVAVQWGIVAVAVAYVVRGYLTAPISIWMLRKLIHIKLTDFLRGHIGQFVGSLVMVVVVWGAKYVLSDLLNLYVLLGVCVGLGALSYVGVMLLIEPKLFRQLLEAIHLIFPRFKWGVKA